MVSTGGIVVGLQDFGRTDVRAEDLRRDTEESERREAWLLFGIEVGEELDIRVGSIGSGFVVGGGFGYEGYLVGAVELLARSRIGHLGSCIPVVCEAVTRNTC